MKMFVSLVTYAIGFTLVWNVLAFLLCMFTGGSYEFYVGPDLIAPLSLMLIIETVTMTTKKKGQSKA